MPFSLDKLADVSRYIYKGFFMTKCVDKSGYDNVLLSSSSQTYVVSSSEDFGSCVRRSLLDERFLRTFTIL